MGATDCSQRRLQPDPRSQLVTVVAAIKAGLWIASHTKSTEIQDYFIFSQHGCCTHCRRHVWTWINRLVCKRTKQGKRVLGEPGMMHHGTSCQNSTLNKPCNTACKHAPAYRDGLHGLHTRLLAASHPATSHWRQQVALAGSS